MKKIYFKYIAIFSLLFSACNKDEEIVIKDPVIDPLAPMLYSVIEYLPAPGQFINENASGFNNIFSMEEACLRAQERLQENNFISLGAWGGYIIVKFNESIPNSHGYDFAIGGNSFDTSNEPGIVWVMSDSNSNGLPDDIWYELKGSYFDKEGYEKNFEVTYFRPQPQGDTYWKDSNGEEGYINWAGSFHNQDFYYPNWVDADSYTLSGSRLPYKGMQNPITGLWENLPFEWGYADNSGSDVINLSLGELNLVSNRFKISDAIDNEGNSVDLKSIDFIKVQTAVLGSSGILGENSTEITGFFPL